MSKPRSERTPGAEPSAITLNPTRGRGDEPSEKRNVIRLVGGGGAGGWVRPWPRMVPAIVELLHPVPRKTCEPRRRVNDPPPALFLSGGPGSTLHGLAGRVVTPRCPMKPDSLQPLSTKFLESRPEAPTPGSSGSCGQC